MATANSSCGNLRAGTLADTIPGLLRSVKRALIRAGLGLATRASNGMPLIPVGSMIGLWYGPSGSIQGKAPLIQKSISLEAGGAPDQPCAAAWKEQQSDHLLKYSAACFA